MYCVDNLQKVIHLSKIWGMKQYSYCAIQIINSVTSHSFSMHEVWRILFQFAVFYFSKCAR